MTAGQQIRVSSLAARQIAGIEHPFPAAPSAKQAAGAGILTKPLPIPESAFAQPVSDPALRKPVVAYLAVTRAIDAKAAEIASLAGAPRGDYDAVSGGWVRRFQGCDIYYSEATGAHEVHGEIKAKYDAVMGPAGRLGFPTTDEGDCPGGRYNYFAHGGIFWTGHTGPMVMSIAMINAWIAAGAQNTLGYPVIDQHQFGAVTPAQDPQTEWCEFENGGIVQTQDGILPALAATLSPGDLRTLIRSKFDAKMHESPDNVGLQPQIETVSVGGWGHGFWASTPRDITFQLHGFHDNGLAADTNFTIAIGLEFGLVWQTGGFSEPATKSLVAKLTYLRVTHRVWLGRHLSVGARADCDRRGQRSLQSVFSRYVAGSRPPRSSKRIAVRSNRSGHEQQHQCRRSRRRRSGRRQLADFGQSAARRADGECRIVSPAAGAAAARWLIGITSPPCHLVSVAAK